MGTSLNTIRKITIQGEGHQSLDTLAASINNVTGAEKRLASASGVTANVTDISTKRQLSATEAYRRQTLAVVDGARAQEQYARNVRVADSALRQGIIGIDEHSKRLGQLQRRYYT